MVKFISHRGNINGVISERENEPSYIKEALLKGFDVEIDVWLINDQFMLGHDEPKHLIEEKFLEDDRLWCHAKNVDALNTMLSNHKIHCFWHQKDNYTITSKKIIWNYPGSLATDKSIILNIGPISKNNQFSNKTICAGVCSDYIEEYYNIYYSLAKCSICNQIKKIENFRKSNQISRGYSTFCKICHNKKNKELYYKNKQI